MADLLSLAEQTLNLKPPCDRCGHPFLHGSEKTCITCLRRSRDPGKVYRRSRFKCDCGGNAVAVVYVGIMVGNVVSQEPLPMCKDCLRIEIDMAANYL